jgi:hypothetical protein
MSVLRDLGRHQKEGVDFVDYLDNGTILLVPKGNPAAIRSPDDLCGRTIVRPMETAAGSILADSDRCSARDQPRIVLMTCPTVPGTQNPELKSAKLADCRGTPTRCGSFSAARPTRPWWTRPCSNRP